MTKPRLCVWKTFSSEMGLLNKYKTVNLIINKYKTVNKTVVFFFLKHLLGLLNPQTICSVLKAGVYGSNPKLELNMTIYQERFYS